ncbi:cupin domain-containing protein [Chitinophaga nivalis]|uniref:Cupin domain-containing protein n=1 Tax=Chitinophaga nivalis TaxID=2991709 RepID=A0ABT3IVY3_9BACT|nr:cupin domain-containing protein [Chitinophaga nivalis]MCW3462209.1 cupin domain-containing protein [Chitinophaga nivalis]MCW3488099.1 cupin domain-containing protein [Chitinophaga nivalis]
MTQVITVHDIPAKHTIPGFQGRFVHGEKSTLAFWEIAAGAVSPLHQHPHEQITYVTEGSFEMELDGEKHLLQQHDVLVIPPHALHGGRAVTACKLIDSFSPARDDYR